MLFDFHMHTFYSDGELSPVELARRCVVNGYTVMAFTDHAGPSNIESVIRKIKMDQAVVEAQWDIKTLVGVELTHIPAATVNNLAKLAKDCGADIVLVHGESPVEPVEPGTNRASVESPWVDVLAHPGLITDEEAKIAAANNVFLEVTSRKGHSLGNGRVVNLARLTGAKLLINSDSHSPGDLHTESFVEIVGLGAGLSQAELDIVRYQNPKLLIEKLRLKYTV